MRQPLRIAGCVAAITVLLSIVCPAQVVQTTANLGVPNRFTALNQFRVGAQLGPVTYVTLPSEADGIMIYCTDCQQTTPCVASGTGAMATGTAGVWACASGGISGANIHLLICRPPPSTPICTRHLRDQQIWEVPRFRSVASLL